MAYKFFVYPFAKDGDKLAIPDPIQVGGSVSYDQGYGADYQGDLLTDPNAKAVPRLQMNQAFYDITLALQQYQTIGIPYFVTTSQNLGTPYSYAKNSMALYDDGVNGLRIYQSLVSANTALPTDTTKWRLLDYTADALVINNVTFEGTVADGDVVYYNAAGSEFSKALANGQAPMNVAGIADVTNGRLYVNGFVNIMTGLTPGTVYYLSDSVAGGVQNPAGLSNVRLGMAISPTGLILQPVVFPLNYYFSVTRNSVQVIPPSTVTVVQWDEVTVDRQGCYNTTTFEFVAKEAGDYVFMAIANIKNTSIPNVIIVLDLMLNGAIVKRTQFATPSATSGNTSSGVHPQTITLEEGDRVAIGIFHTDSINQDTNASGFMNFSGYKLPTQT